MNILKEVIHDKKTNSVEATWEDADGVQVKCHSYADVQMDMFRADVLALGGNIAEHEAMIAAVEAAIVPYVAPPPVIPNIVSMRRARLALLGAGLLDSVNTAVASMAGVEGEAARIEWEYATEVDRNSALVGGLAQMLALTPAQLDSLFTTASTL